MGYQEAFFVINWIGYFMYLVVFFPIFDEDELYLIFSRPYFALHMGWTRKTWLFIRFETHTFLHWSASFEGCSIIWQRSFCSENCLFTPDWRLCCGFQWWKSGFSIFINCQLRSKCKLFQIIVTLWLFIKQNYTILYKTLERSYLEDIETTKTNHVLFV